MARPEAGAAVPAGGRGVGLREGLEEPVLRGRVEADPGVADLHPHQRPRRRAAGEVDGDDDLSLGGELDRVGDQVEQDLADPARVAAEQGRDVGGDVGQQVEPVRAGVEGGRLRHVVDHLGQRERHGLQLDPAGLDLGEVQDVVDQAQQGPAGGLDTARVLPLPVVEVGRQEQLGQPGHPVHRGPDLVAHGGQEGRLGAGGVLGRVPGGGEVARRRAPAAGAGRASGRRRGRPGRSWPPRRSTPAPAGPGARAARARGSARAAAGPRPRGGPSPSPGSPGDPGAASGASRPGDSTAQAIPTAPPIQPRSSTGVGTPKEAV